MQMGKFPKPCEKEERGSVLPEYKCESPVLASCDSLQAPQLRSRHTVGTFTTWSLSQKMGQMLISMGSSPGRLGMSVIYFGEVSLWEGSITCVFGGKCGHFQQSSSSSCRNHFPRILISGTQKGNLEKGLVMRLLATRSWKLSGSKGPLCVGL